ncbi:MAG: RidA family protein [Candidatus Marinarcus sp.]|uniref:RidA family protein n=1 Tax=Candidatus Marinarcus sp. TaxID=3100987 RepID=UPI003B00ABD5
MITRKEVGSRMSKIVEYNGVVYFSGIVPNDKSLDLKGQTKEVLQMAEELFERAFTDKNHLLRAEIYLKDIDKDFQAFNEVYDAWISKEHPPARACVQASMSTPQTLVEIVFTAAKIQ